jgi:hypothetical protein
VGRGLTVGDDHDLRVAVTGDGENDDRSAAANASGRWTLTEGEHVGSNRTSCRTPARNAHILIDLAASESRELARSADAGSPSTSLRYSVERHLHLSCGTRLVDTNTIIEVHGLRRGSGVRLLRGVRAERALPSTITTARAASRIRAQD